MMPTRHRPAAIATLAATLALALLASCGSTATSDETTAETPLPTADADSGPGGTATPPEAERSSAGPDAADSEAPVDRLAYVADDSFTPDPVPTAPPPETTTSTAAPAPSQPATTAGSGGAPVTTIGSPDGGDVSIYQGVLGTLGPDDQVTAAVAPAPSTAPGTFPLTGLAGSASGPAIVVKVDNGSAARPQTGLNKADIVVEEEVEGGITRFAAIFHSTDTVVGPVRSGRTTDIGILNSLGSPLFAYSGANDVTDTLLRAQSAVQNRSAARSSGYWRESSRRAPSNLYTDTAPHRASATGSVPPAQFAFRAPGEPAGGEPDDSLTVAYRASTAAWTWDGTAWLRSQGGQEHRTAWGDRVSAANVVVIEAAEVATGMVDSSGAPVPEFVFVGSGPATVFTDGHRIAGTWTRPTLASPATLTTPDGAVIELTPGRTWIELIEAGAGMLR